MKKAIIPILLTLLLSFFALADEPEFDVNPGLTPDSPFYFLDELFESESDDPDDLLAHRQEKIAEALAMAKERDSEHAEEALEKARRYGEVLQEEVPPELEEDARKHEGDIHNVLKYIGDEIPEIKDKTLENIDQEKKIVLAAKVSKKIHDLCETLSQLDPKQYAETCKADDDSPEWRKRQHQELTKDQEKHAKEFAKALKQCVEEPENCDCNSLGVPKLEAICKHKSVEEADCRANEDECRHDGEDFNPEDFLPDYLLPVFMDVMGDFDHDEGDRGFDRMMPPECEGLDEAECMKVMWEKDTPEECKEAGLTGESKSDFKKCDEIRRDLEERKEEERKEESFEEPPGFQYDGPDCTSLEGEDQLRCFEDFFRFAQGKYQEERPDEFVGCPSPQEYEEEKRECEAQDMWAEFTKEGDCGVVTCVPPVDFDKEYDASEPNIPEDTLPEDDSPELEDPNEFECPDFAQEKQQCLDQGGQYEIKDEGDCGYLVCNIDDNQDGEESTCPDNSDMKQNCLDQGLDYDSQETADGCSIITCKNKDEESQDPEQPVAIPGEIEPDTSETSPEEPDPSETMPQEPEESNTETSPQEPEEVQEDNGDSEDTDTETTESN
tara:strand:- start:5886 stop:7715 length:1830 start_codon:yes stop_codon:yes gene_type:complete